METRTGLLINNMLVYGLATVSSKIVAFILTFFYTRFFNPDALGLYEMALTFLNLVSPFGLLGINIALFRLFADKNKESDQNLVMNAVVLVLVSTIFICVTLFLSKPLVIRYFIGDERFSRFYTVSVILILLTNVKTIMTLLFKIQNDRRQILFLTFTSSLAALLLNIVGLFVFNISLEAVLFITCIIDIFSVLYSGILNRRLLSSKIDLSVSVMKDLLRIGLPLVPSGLIYWVLGGYDRWAIGRLLDFNELGIYAVGAKVASVSYIIKTVFTSGWSFFMYRVMSDKDADVVYGKVYDIVSFFGFALCSIMAVISIPLFRIALPAEYQAAYATVGLLSIGPIFIILGWIAGVGVHIMKRSELMTYSIVLAGLLNVVLNELMIPEYGIVGASAATMISNFASLAFLFFTGRKLYKIKISFLKSCINFIVYSGLLALILSDKLQFGIKILITISYLIWILFVFRDSISFLLQKARLYPKSLHQTKR